MLWKKSHCQVTCRRFTSRFIWENSLIIDMKPFRSSDLVLNQLSGSQGIRRCRFSSFRRTGIDLMSSTKSKPDGPLTPGYLCPWVVLKISTCVAYSRDMAEHELEINQRLKRTNPCHVGHSTLHTMFDSFQITGP